MTPTISLSANIENGFSSGSRYIATPNAKLSTSNIVDAFRSGVHSFTIIGSYGTGKSSFLLAFESDLKGDTKNRFLFNPSTLHDGKFRVVNIVGDYDDLSHQIKKAIGVDSSRNGVVDELKHYYGECRKRNEFLVIVIDEFGKVLEHAAHNNPEKELYLIQKIAEFANSSERQVLLLTTLHQNFNAYAKGLTKEQTNEWSKVKGRFKEITFVEPIEQILFLATQQYTSEKVSSPHNIAQLHALATETHFVSPDFSEDTSRKIYPLDPFSACVITSAIRRYGQNERSLFTFLASKGRGSFGDFIPDNNYTFNPALVYDYVTYSFQSYIRDANVDSMSWNAIQVAIERAEGHIWNSHQQMLSAINIIKAVGMFNMFGGAGFKLNTAQLVAYAENAMSIADADDVVRLLIEKKIVRYAVYKERIQLFEGTDVDLEAEIREAGMMVARPVAFVDELNVFFNKRIAPVKAHYYQKGTPRFFDYRIEEQPLDITPAGDTDGYIELIFSTKREALKELKQFSADSEHALIFAFFTNTEDIVDHLHNIKKYLYLLERVLDKNDRVAVSEIQKLKEYEEALLNKAISDNLFAYQNRVVWIYKGEEKSVRSHRNFNRLLSEVCDDVYSQTPVMNNELFNKHKLSGTISAAKKNYLTALVEHSSEPELGFPADKFPPEKTIFCSLLKHTGLYVGDDFSDRPNNEGIMPLWDACEEFLQSTENKARKVSELIKKLSVQPYKLKQGFLDFWIPTYLYIKRQDFALYDASRGAYMPEVNMEFFDLLQKHPGDYEIKKFAVDGVKLGFFNQYRKFVNLGDEFAITNANFIETIKPFLSFYVRLDDYTKHTRKFDHESTMRFRDVLAKAKDPEKAFFEDIPEALGFDQDKLRQKEFIDQYGFIIQRAIRELRSCYNELIDRLEERLVDGLGLESGEYSNYVEEIRQRLANVKTYLLTDKQREFYHHAMTEYDNRKQWYQSICYTILEQRLDTLRDEQEDKLADDLVYLFRECEKYASISAQTSENDKSEAYSFDLVTNRGTNIRTQTYVLPERDKRRASELEAQISRLLSGDTNVDVCTLLSILNKKMKR